MEALSCDGYICGIRNILIRNSVVNREMKFVRIHGQTQLEPGGAPRRVTKDNKCCWNYPNGRRHPDLWPNFFAVGLLITVLSLQLGTSF